MLMIGEKQPCWPEPSKNTDLVRMREVDRTDAYVPDHPLNDPEGRHRIGRMISGASQGRLRRYNAGSK